MTAYKISVIVGPAGVSLICELTLKEHQILLAFVLFCVILVYNLVAVVFLNRQRDVI